MELLFSCTIFFPAALGLWINGKYSRWVARCPKCGKQNARVLGAFVERERQKHEGWQERRIIHRDKYGVMQSYSTYDVPKITETSYGYYSCSCAYCRHTWQLRASGPTGQVSPPSEGEFFVLVLTAILAIGLWALLTSMIPHSAAASAPSASPSESSAPSSPRAQRQVRFSARCRMREMPSLTARIVGSVPAGQALSVLDTYDDYWYQVRVGHTTGWAGCRPAPRE